MWEIQRTHTCGEIRRDHEGETVSLNGWIETVRDHGKVLFIDLRDRYGTTQVVFKEDVAPELHRRANTLKPESVLGVRGAVVLRDEATRNPNMPTGDIEVVADRLDVINEAKTPPFEISEELTGSIELRLKYRYLDLRRPTMQGYMEARSRVTHEIRRYFNEKGFFDLETPVMLKYTPGGARNFLVPSRLFPGECYALAESPQILKQLYMIAGFDRYYQIARCFRDEDLRADRQPEFTQLDMEMSFVRPEDVMKTVEACIARVISGLTPPFETITYEKAMQEYGTDKPDLRVEMRIGDVGEAFRGTDFGIARSVLEHGGCIRGFAIKGGAELSRKDVDGLNAYVANLGGKGVLNAKVEAADKLTGGFAKFLDGPRTQVLCVGLGAEPGDMVVLIAGKPDRVALMLGALRVHVAEKRGLLQGKPYRACWVVDFPLLEEDQDGNHVARHHPFTSPNPEDLDKLESDPLAVRALAYDLVINGVEIGGGSIRIHRHDVQSRVFKAIGLSDAEAKEKFGFFLEAFEYGAPPHGGIALGLDRLVMIVLGLDSIRDVIPFPKTQRAQDLMMGSPSPVSDPQLKELGIQRSRKDG